MELELCRGMFEGQVPLFGSTTKTVDRVSKKLKYWLGGYAFYKSEDGKIFAKQLKEACKEQFYWNHCGKNADLEYELEELHQSYQQDTQQLEKLTDLAAPYGVAPITFETAFTKRNEPIIKNLAFITVNHKKYFEVASVDDFYNITTATAIELETFEENTFANPHKITINENGLVAEKA